LARGIRILITNQQKLDQSAFAAGALLVAIPISIFFILLRNFLIGGITAGGVKG
jgi:arabinogalactan oligomer/maltooligosaccharide transport system permease protein